MIAIKHNSLIFYSVVVVDDKFVFKYNCRLRYNLLSIIKIDDTIELDEFVDFKTAKKMMMATITSLNKILN